MSAAASLSGPLLADRYALLGSIGAGGMATVYRGHDHKLDRAVAIKVMRPELQGDERVMRRFRNESRVLAQLDHPRVSRLLDIGETPAGLPYMIQEWIDGTELGTLIGNGPPSLVRIGRIGAQLAEALAAIHAAGVVHGDVKPDNVIMMRAGCPDESAKLVDFGLAQLCRAPLLRLVPSKSKLAELCGTPEYMAPELIKGALPAPAMDLYAFGALLYELLTGDPPFTDADPTTLLVRHLRETPVAPSLRRPGGLPRAIDALVLSLLGKQPAERPDSAGELALRLAQAFAAVAEVGQVSDAGTELDLEVEMYLEIDVDLDFEPEAAPAPELALVPSGPPLPRDATMQALLDQGVVSAEHLDDALRAVAGSATSWQEQLVLLGHLDEVAYCRCLSRKLRLPECDPRQLAHITDEVLAELPTAVMLEHQVMPLFVDDDGDLHVAMVDPIDPRSWDEVQFFAGQQRRVLREIIGPSAMAWALYSYCGTATVLWPPARRKPRALVVDLGAAGGGGSACAVAAPTR